jgi:flagellar basal-body rod protein FlgB
MRSQFSGNQLPSPSSVAAINPHLAEDPNVRTVRPDGNSVEIETELMAMSRNRVDHEFLTEIVSRHIKQLKMAITGRVT